MLTIDAIVFFNFLVLEPKEAIPSMAPYYASESLKKKVAAENKRSAILLCTYSLFALFIISWAIYGMVGQFSSENLCYKYKETETLNMFMKVMTLYILLPAFVIIPIL